MSRPFRRASGTPLPREAAARQGRILQLAIATLGSVDALAFMNAHSDELGGRPIDLAVASVDGLNAVEALLKLTQR